MVWRICFFLLGGISYVLLSWVLQLPDPEDLLHSNDFVVLMDLVQYYRWDKTISTTFQMLACTISIYLNATIILKLHSS